MSTQMLHHPRIVGVVTTLPQPNPHAPAPRRGRRSAADPVAIARTRFLASLVLAVAMFVALVADPVGEPRRPPEERDRSAVGAAVVTVTARRLPG